jgi:hypothetical protein
MTWALLAKYVITRLGCGFTGSSVGDSLRLISQVGGASMIAWRTRSGMSI